MEKAFKFLRGLEKKRRKQISQIFADILNLDLDHLDVKKLQGRDNQFRVRVGKFRIIFKKQKNKGIILDIRSRGDIY